MSSQTVSKLEEIILKEIIRHDGDVNVIFLTDTSGSVVQHIPLIIQCLRGLLSRIGIEETNQRVMLGLVQFGTESKVDLIYTKLCI